MTCKPLVTQSTINQQIFIDTSTPCDATINKTSPFASPYLLANTLLIQLKVTFAHTLILLKPAVNPRYQ